MEDTDAWSRAGEAVRDRREALGLTQEAAVSQGRAVGFSISTATWRAVETGKRDRYRGSSLVAICWVLGWEPDGIKRLLVGDEPVEGRLPVIAGPRENFIHIDPADPTALRTGHGGSEGWPPWLEQKFLDLQAEVTAQGQQIAELQTLIVERFGSAPGEEHPAQTG